MDTKNILIVRTDGMEEWRSRPLIEIPGWTKIVEGIGEGEREIAGWDDVIHLKMTGPI